MSDWYDSMMEYEQKHGEHYGIDVKGGLIEIWRLATYETVARFTAQQAGIFFEGLVNHGDTGKSNALLDWNISYVTGLLNKRGVGYQPAVDNMSTKEWYCYLVQYAQRYKLIDDELRN